MKRAVLVLLLTVTVGVAGYFVSLKMAGCPEMASHAHADSGMVWLRREYHLNDAQFASIARMHDEYRPTCARMCERVAIARKKINDLTATSRTTTPEIETALKEWALVQNECRVAMLRHVYAVSAEMRPEDGERYVKMAVKAIVEPGMSHASLLAK